MSAKWIPRSASSSTIITCIDFGMKGPAQKMLAREDGKARRSAGEACSTILLVPSCRPSRLGFAHAILPKEMPSLIGTSLAFPGSGLDQAQPCPRTIRRLIAWTILPVSTAAGGALAGTLDPGYVLASL